MSRLSPSFFIVFLFAISQDTRPVERRGIVAWASVTDVQAALGPEPPHRTAAGGRPHVSRKETGARHHLGCYGRATYRVPQFVCGPSLAYSGRRGLWLAGSGSRISMASRLPQREKKRNDLKVIVNRRRPERGEADRRFNRNPAPRRKEKKILRFLHSGKGSNHRLTNANHRGMRSAPAWALVTSSNATRGEGQNKVQEGCSSNGAAP